MDSNIFDDAGPSSSTASRTEPEEADISIYMDAAWDPQEAYVAVVAKNKG